MCRCARSLPEVGCAVAQGTSRRLVALVGTRRPGRPFQSPHPFFQSDHLLQQVTAELLAGQLAQLPTAQQLVQRVVGGHGVTPPFVWARSWDDTAAPRPAGHKKQPPPTVIVKSGRSYCPHRNVLQ